MPSFIGSKILNKFKIPFIHKRISLKPSIYFKLLKYRTLRRILILTILNIILIANWRNIYTSLQSEAESV